MDSPNATEAKAHPSAAKPAVKFSLGAILSPITSFFSATQNIIGIDIGSNTFKIVQLQKTAKGYLIANYITRAIPRSIKDNPAEKKRIIQEFIKEFIKNSRIKTTLGRLAIWGKGVFIFSLNVPLLNKKDLRGAVSMELKKRLPFQLNLDTISFDFFVTGQQRDEKGITILQVTCIACDRFTLEEQVQLLKDMRLRPLGLCVIPDAIGNLLSHCVKINPQKSIAILDMGANSSTLNFYKGGILSFSREIPVGGDHLTGALARTITTPSGSVTISQEDAEKIKRQCGIPSAEEAKIEFLTDFGTILGEQISSMLRSLLERLVMEINRTLAYYTSTFKASAIEELFLTGGSSRLKNINKFFLDNLKELKKIENLDALKAVKGWKDTGIYRQELMMEQAVPHLAAAFGLCLGKGAKINLLPLKEKIEQQAFFLITILKIVVPIILGLSMLYYGILLKNARKHKASVNSINIQLRQLEPIVAKAREYRDTYIKLEQRKKLLEQTSSHQPLWWGAFKELGTITPEEVVFSKITVVNTKEMHIEGKISAKYTIVDLELSQYVLTLEDSPFFEQVRQVPEKTKQDMYSAIPTASFEIVCLLTY
ncbi:MAG: hypothetical protein A2Y00_04910 [Omnitrophica WOR_2 bacterium GWF2_43_52]|nr:MAG: hypothetical protein A2Y01_05695 [Omnitrophica WOR_2 bacterium GWC2_44_8]OGX20448.1 MAG: hypothetical protein A2Y00_04910 [Omnitrophica WOR_2 bacterium GWF2_43_52]OGX53034.1 MAG: hypothetical protein A2460_06490 [Omnitrophica WOR_2 bacterium RIFOXYC2_FULL_43_9]HAH20502.1 hypothetical protein [Candidatus Omnitrophota bacterium]HBG62953.1 hypothetical protein [Candidatus Omnitrophota bacterium]